MQLEIVMIPTNRVIPYWRNPRRNDKTVDALCETIPVHGFNVPIVVDKHYVVVKGHARLKAAKRLGMEKVPCIISDAPEDVIKADRIADNKIQELSAWDFGKLNFELAKRETPVFNKLFRPEENPVSVDGVEPEDIGYKPVGLDAAMYDMDDDMAYQPPTAAYGPSQWPTTEGNEHGHGETAPPTADYSGPEAQTGPRQCKTLCPYCGKVVVVTV